jgi:hypothetical protein
MFRDNYFIIKFLFISLIFLFTIFSVENAKLFYPYFSNVITEYIQDVDNPFRDEKWHYLDLCFILFYVLFVVKVFEKIKSKKLIHHFKIIFLIKILFVFFLVTYYEKNALLDEKYYFDILYNNKIYFWHYNDLSITNISNRTAFFLNIINILFFFVPKTWFGMKFILCVTYIYSVFMILKIYQIFRGDKNIIFFLYLVAFFPSFFLFSSYLTKEIISIPLLLTSFFLFCNMVTIKKLNYFFIFLMILLILLFIRWWVAMPFILSLMITAAYYLKLNKNFLYLLFLCLFALSIFIFMDNHIFNLTYKYLLGRAVASHTLLNLPSYTGQEVKSLEFLDIILYYLKESFFYILNFNFTNINYILFNFENLFLIFFTINAFFQNNNHKLNYLIVFIFIYLILFSILHAVSNTHLNFGTSLRFSVQVKIFYLLIIFLYNKDFISWFISYLSLKLSILKKN